MTPIQPNTPCPNCGLIQGSYEPEPHHLPPGTLLMDRYLIGRALGSGGFGITYIGRDTRLDLRVAIKEYFPNSQVGRSPGSNSVFRYNSHAGRSFEHGLDRFIKEARALARMEKTTEIVAVRDYFQANNTAYIVMEYVNGTTLKELVAQNGGPLPAGELLAMIRPMFGALEALHEQGLIHRDISPDNIMLENGKVRLLDFGCAKESLDGPETSTIFLKTGFSPLEQYHRKGQGAWSDVYSLAATIYYCITGTVPQPPVERVDVDELIPPRELGASLTEQQEAALLHGMELRSADRFQSVQDFYASLYEGAPIPDVPKRPRTTTGAYSSTAPGLQTQQTSGSNQTSSRTGTEIPPTGPAVEVGPTGEEHRKEDQQTGQNIGNFPATQSPEGNFPATKTPENPQPKEDSQNQDAPAEEPSIQPADRAGSVNRPADQASGTFRQDETSDEQGPWQVHFSHTNPPESQFPVTKRQSAFGPSGESTGENTPAEPQDNNSEDFPLTQKPEDCFPATQSPDTDHPPAEQQGADTKPEKLPAKDKKQKQSSSKDKQDRAKGGKNGIEPDGPADNSNVQEPPKVPSKSRKAEEDELKKSSGGPKKALIGVGAAAILGAGILVAVLNGGPDPAPNPDSTQAPGQNSSASETIQPEPEGFPVTNFETLKKALSDDSVDAIRVPAGSTVAVRTTIVVDKPMILEENSKMNFQRTVSFAADCTVNGGAQILCSGSSTTFSAGLTIADNGSITIDGQNTTVSEGGAITVAQNGTLDATDCTNFTLDGGKLSISGTFHNNFLVHTCNGGTITLKDTGSADFGLVWLQQSGDFTGAEQASIQKTVVLDDAVFENVTSVSDMDALEAALADPSVPAVGIDAALHLDRSLSVEKPLLIPEELHFIADGESNSQLTVSSLILNQGFLDDLPLTLQGGSCINNGSAALFLSGGDDSILVNSGDITFLNSSLHAAQFINLGRANVGAPDWALQAVFTEGGFWNLRGSIFTVQPGSVCTANLGLGLHNGGTVTVEKGGTLVNNAVLDGTVEIRGTVENEGGILRGNPTLVGNVNGGLVLTDPDNAQRYNRPQTTYLLSYTPSEEETVHNTQEFRNLCDDGATSIRLAGGDVTIDGALELQQSLTIAEDSSLVVNGPLTLKNGAVLTVEGTLTADNLVLEESSLLVSHGADDSRGIRINKGGIHLIDSTAEIYGLIRGVTGSVRLALENNSVLYNEGEFRCMELSLTDSHLTNSGDLQLRSGTTITLINSVFSTTANCSVIQGGLSVDSNSLFLCSDTLRLENSAVDNDGIMKLASGQCRLVSQAGSEQFTNRGILEFGTFFSGHQFDFNGSGSGLVNKGTLNLYSSLSMNDLENNGEMYIMDGAQLNIRISASNTGSIYLSPDSTCSGEITGNPPQNS